MGMSDEGRESRRDGGYYTGVGPICEEPSSVGDQLGKSVR